MRSLRSTALFVVAIAASIVGRAAAQGCLVSPNATGFLLPPVSDVPANHGMCPVGFYCPNSHPNDTATWPRICPPTPACIRKRTVEFKYCEPQGAYEPTVCPQGYYCPDGRTKVVCPKGSRCPYGSTAPYECGALSLCPEGSRTELFVGVVLVLVLVDAAAGATFALLRRVADAPSALDEAVAKESVDEAAVTVARLVRKALGPAEPVTVSFQNLTVALPADHKTAPGKMLLQGVSGNIRAGEVTAIMGPSGAGKTVLFTTLLGKQPAEWETGGVLRVCGESTFHDFAPLVGFVPQDDVLRVELTVAENVRYASEVRLPAEWTPAERLELRTAVLRALSIAHVRDVPIGDEERRGVSGGQRKRCSVAVELASAPAAIFLDEPTTGLDATTSLELVRLLKVVAREARVPVAMVVHQPRVEIWDELDTVLLLAPGGRTVYSGPREGAAAYLGRLHPEVSWAVGNPCDIAMDLIADRGAELADAWDRQVEGTSPLLVVTAPPTRATAGYLRQFAAAHLRAAVVQLRSPVVLALDVALGMVGGVLLTAAAVDEPFVGQLVGPYAATSPRTDIQVTSMLMMLWGIALATALGPAGVRAIGRARGMYWRETAAGHSRIAFYLGSTTAELYRVVLSVLHLSAVVYLMWRPNMGFGALLWWLLLLGFCMDSQALALGTIVDPAIAPLLSVVMGVFASLLNGFPQIPAASQVSYSFVLTERAYASEVADVRHVFRTSVFEDFWGYSIDRPGYDYGLVFGWAALLRLLGFVFLARLHRDKQR